MLHFYSACIVMKKLTFSYHYSKYYTKGPQYYLLPAADCPILSFCSCLFLFSAALRISLVSEVLSMQLLSGLKEQRSSRDPRQ